MVNLMQEWKPKTELGVKANSGKITDIAEVFREGLKIRESWIVDKLLPNLKSEIIFFGGSPGKGGGITRTSTRRTARMHRSGRRYRISALVAVGAPGYIGLGKSSAKEHSVAINKATEAAKLNIIPIKMGCGSWECVCGKGHSVPAKAVGKSGSVVISLLPAPRGIGLCIADEGKKMMRLAGIQDIWTKTEGQSQTRYNYVWAIYDAFKSLNRIKIDFPEPKAAVKVEEVPVKTEKDETAELDAADAAESATEVEAKEKSDETEEKNKAIARPELEGGVEVEG
jgi:small subunit ribosomal protein S5